MKKRPHLVDGLSLDNLTIIELEGERARLIEKLSKGHGTQKDAKAWAQINAFIGELRAAISEAVKEQKSAMSR